ncbi:hypothetical protein D3C87_1107430 [compost metagenome]
MFFAAMTEVIVQAFLFAEALDEVQIRFPVLHAVFARRICRDQMKLVKLTVQAVILQYFRNDLRDGQLLENALVGSVRQIGQLRYQRQAVTSQAFAAIATGDAIDLAVNAIAMLVEGQESLFMQQVFQVQIGSFANQFDLEGVGFTDVLVACELKDLKVVFIVSDGEGETGIGARIEHS